jgi:hypothetical protein
MRELASPLPGTHTIHQLSQYVMLLKRSTHDVKGYWLNFLFCIVALAFYKSRAVPTPLSELP